jgi:hypothetical protein
MDELTALAILRRFFPGLARLLVVAAFVFAPGYSTAVIMHIARERAKPITSALEESVESSFANSRQLHSRKAR